MFRICSDFSENVQNVQNLFRIFSQCSEWSDFFRISSTKTGLFIISWLFSDYWHVFLHTALLMLCRSVVPYWQMDQMKISHQISSALQIKIWKAVIWLAKQRSSECYVSYMILMLELWVQIKKILSTYDIISVILWRYLKLHDGLS